MRKVQSVSDMKTYSSNGYSNWSSYFRHGILGLRDLGGHFFAVAGFFIGLAVKGSSRQSESKESQTSVPDFIPISSSSNTDTSPFVPFPLLQTVRKMNFGVIGLSIASSSKDEGKHDGTLGPNQIVFRQHGKSISIKCEVPPRKSKLLPEKLELAKSNSQMSCLHEKKWKSNTCKPNIISTEDIKHSKCCPCLTAHGPKPRTILVFGDIVLECDRKKNPVGSAEDNKGLKHVGPACSNGFLSHCFYCNKKLQEGSDLFFCRDKAFCSFQCQCMEIFTCGLGEGFERSLRNHPGCSFQEDISLSGLHFNPS